MAGARRVPPESSGSVAQVQQFVYDRFTTKCEPEHIKIFAPGSLVTRTHYRADTGELPREFGAWEALGVSRATPLIAFPRPGTQMHCAWLAHRVLRPLLRRLLRCLIHRSPPATPMEYRCALSIRLTQLPRAGRIVPSHQHHP